LVVGASGNELLLEVLVRETSTASLLIQEPV
jgi:hypothetical protein